MQLGHKCVYIPRGGDDGSLELLLATAIMLQDMRIVGMLSRMINMYQVPRNAPEMASTRAGSLTAGLSRRPAGPCTLRPSQIQPP